MSQSSYGAVPSLTASQIIGMGAGQNPAYTISKNKMNLPGITFKITQANGGTIVTVTEEARRSENSITLSGYGEREELYIIPEDVKDFDRELGKIITLHRMKQQHE
jgi:hypothetical protein